MTHAMLKGSNVPLNAKAVRSVLRWAPGQGVPEADGKTFDRVRALRILLYDAALADGEPLAYFDIKPETGEETALICGELYRRGEGWKFRALGEGYANGIEVLAGDFGIEVDESEPA